MNPTAAQILELDEECVQLCRRLSECLREERAALIQARMEEVHRLNGRKEGLLSFLQQKKNALLTLARSAYGVSSLDELTGKLEGVEPAAWRLRRANWRAAWEEMHALARRNQTLLRHSLRNLGLLVDQMRRLFGESGTYTNRGVKSDATSPGKVMEARF